jgi:hypothetical protein
MIVHLEKAIKMQDLELDERAEMIATLEQQLQVPPTPEDPDEANAMLGID